MATFASRELSEKVEEEDQPEGAAGPSEKPEKDVLGIVKTGPKLLSTGETSSLFKLKNEFLKRKDRLEQQRIIKATGTHVAGKSNILSTKKEERERQAREDEARSVRMAKNERALRREEDAERLLAAKHKLTEKSELYDRMQEGHVVLANPNDDTPIDFLVDFGTKKRRIDEERAADRERYREQEEAAPVGFGRAPIPDQYHHSEEQRVYGTSHMRLSMNQNKRKDEIEKLLEMSKKTDIAKAKQKEEKKKKEAIKRANLNKLRIKNGLEPLPEREPTPPPPEIDLDSIPLPGQKETPEERHARLMKSDREWDRGKGHYTTWIEKQRDERDDEFRPPDSYYQ
uniref:Coiled-coil domain-containing protein 174 n=1 Tax=Caenorhabditis tropicalis TaxID=1561998 RepID=A0A1I7T854_9PELO